MDERGPSPGPIADRTFETGFKLATAAGLAGVVMLYWFGALSLSNSLHLTFTLQLFPVYLLFVAVLLGVWLGYDEDVTNLRPASEEAGSESDGPGENWPR